MRLLKLNTEKGKILSYAVMDHGDYSHYPFFYFTGTKETDFIDINEKVLTSYLNDRGMDNVSIMPIDEDHHMKNFVIEVKEVDIDTAVRLGFGVVEIEGKRYLFDADHLTPEDEFYYENFNARLALYHFLTMGLFRDRVLRMKADGMIRILIDTDDYWAVEQEVEKKLDETRGLLQKLLEKTIFKGKGVLKR
ncbi:MAG: hypothetical protein H0Z32_11770 [Bacillaceae bacterium]|nr:hypothetical protein [Bacillaceae bacterium]